MCCACVRVQQGPQMMRMWSGMASWTRSVLSMGALRPHPCMCQLACTLRLSALLVLSHKTSGPGCCLARGTSK